MGLRLKNRTVSSIFLLASGEFKITFSNEQSAIINEKKVIDHIDSWIFLEKLRFESVEKSLVIANIEGTIGINKKAQKKLIRMLSRREAELLSSMVNTKTSTPSALSTSNEFSEDLSNNIGNDEGILKKVGSLFKKIGF